MTDNLIDETVLDELQNDTGAEFLEELVTTFLEEAPGMIAELKSAKETSDADTFRRAAHSIKSNANVFGATSLSELAMKMELEGDKAVEISALEDVLSKTEHALRGYLDA